MVLNNAAQALINNFPLGFVATVTAEGMPSLSPKGTFLILDDETIAFAEIRSPQTMANLDHLARCEVNFIDIWKRKGIRIAGPVEVCPQGTAEFETFFPRWEETFPALAPRINAIVKIGTESVKLVTTPPYDDGATEEDMISLYKRKFAEIYP